MGDEPRDNVNLGENAKADLKGRALELLGVLDEIDELKVRAKEIKDSAKSEGYDMKAFAQVIKELRKGAEYQAAQLTLELVLDTYRGAVDLPRDLEAAQKASAISAEELPAETKKKRGGGDKPKHVKRGLN